MIIYYLLGSGHYFLHFFDFLFLGLIQFIVYQLFKKFPPEEERIQRFGKIQFRTLSKPQLMFFYLGLIVCGWYLNERFQIFCNFVLYANILLWACLSSILIDAYFNVQNKFWSAILFFFQGVGIAIFIYLIIYWNSVFTTGIFFTITSLLPFFIGFIAIYFFVLKKTDPSGLPLIIVLLTIYSPFLFLFQILENTLRTNAVNRIILVLGLACSFLIAHQTLSQYQSFLKKYSVLKYEEALEIDTKDLTFIEFYFLERSAGLHFKYHTRPAFVDGWRPPMHDPIIVYCFQTAGQLPFVQRVFNYSRELNLYKKLFPDLPVRMNCSCGKAGSKSYFNDERLN